MWWISKLSLKVKVMTFKCHIIRAVWSRWSLEEFPLVSILFSVKVKNHRSCEYLFICLVGIELKNRFQRAHFFYRLVNEICMDMNVGEKCLAAIEIGNFKRNTKRLWNETFLFTQNTRVWKTWWRQNVTISYEKMEKIDFNGKKNFAPLEKLFCRCWHILCCFNIF